MKFAVFTVLLVAVVPLVVLVGSALGRTLPVRPPPPSGISPSMDSTAMQAQLAGAMGTDWVGLLHRVMTPQEWRAAEATGAPPKLAKTDPRRAFLEERMEANKARVAQEADGAPVEERLPFDNPPKLSPEELAAQEAYYFGLTDVQKEEVWNKYRWGNLKLEAPGLYNFLTFKLLETKPGLETRDACDAFIEGEFYLVFIYGNNAASIEVFNPFSLSYEVRQTLMGTWSHCHIFFEKKVSIVPTHFLVLTNAEAGDSMVYEKVHWADFIHFQTLMGTDNVFGCEVHQSWGHTFMCLARDPGLLYEWDRNTGFVLHSTEPLANGEGCSIMRLTPWPTDTYEERNLTESLAKSQVDVTWPPEYLVAWIIVPEDDDDDYDYDYYEDYDYDYYDYDVDYFTHLKRFIGTVRINSFVAGGNAQPEFETIDNLETVVNVHFMTQGLFWQRRVYLGVVQFADAAEANSEVNSLVFRFDRSTWSFLTEEPQPIPGVGAVRMQSIHPGGLLPFEWSQVHLMFTLTNREKLAGVQIIEDEEDLQNIRDDLGGTYLLVGTVTCTQPFEPIGSSEDPFCGTLMGAELENAMPRILNCNIAATRRRGVTTGEATGLFAHLGGPDDCDATIMNIMFEDNTVMGGNMEGDTAGTVAGVCESAFISGVMITSSSESGHARIAAVEGYTAAGAVGHTMPDCTLNEVVVMDVGVNAAVGGCVVGVNEGEITDSGCDGMTTVQVSDLGGGLTGVNSGGTVMRAYVTDLVTVETLFDGDVGGLTALNDGDGLFQDCYSRAMLIVEDGDAAYCVAVNGLLFEQGTNATRSRANNGFLNRVYGAGDFTISGTATTGGLAAVYGSTNGGPDTDISNSVWDKTSQTTSAGSSNSFGRDPGTGAGELGNVATYDPTLGWDFTSLTPVWCMDTTDLPVLAQLQPADCAGPQYDHLRNMTARDLFKQRAQKRAPLIRRLMEPTVEVSSTVWCYSNELRAFELCDTLPPGAASTGNLLTYRLPIWELGLVQTNSEDDTGNPSVDNKIFRRGIA